MISILHPSRQRSAQSLETLTKWKERAVLNPEIIISVDIDDSHRMNYQLNAEALGAKLIINENRSAVDAINRAAEEATQNIFIVVSDDTDCPPGWDAKIVKETAGLTDWIMKCPDGIQKWIITMPVMDRIYYNRFGYVYYPEFRHMFCDTFMSCVADLTGRRINSNILFPHLHYSVRKSPKDQLNERADATWKQGEELFINLVKQNFLLDPEQVKGQITDQNYLKWIQARL